MSELAESLLTQAEMGEQGRRALFAASKDAKELADEAVFLATSLHKFARNEDVSCAAFAFDEEAERLLYVAVHDARVAVSQAREKVTAELLKALKASGRV